jgi:hypothetical protein
MNILRIYIPVLIFMTVSLNTVDAQYFTGVGNIPVSNDFYKMQKEINAYFKANPDQKKEKQWGRFESFMEPRVYPHGNIAQYKRTTMAAQDRFLKQTNSGIRSPQGQWVFMGPSSSPDGSFGRCLRVKFHPTNANIFFVLSSSGGLWKTIDNASTWKNITPDIPLLYAVDFAIDQDHPDTMYLLTGNERQSVMNNVYSQGMLKTVDGGNTWHPTEYAFPAFTMPYKLVMYPDSSEIMYAATRAGIYRTDDAWNTATYVLAPELSKEMRDIEFKPGNPTVMYASSNNHVYKSTNRGVFGSWNHVTDPDFGGLDSMRRIELAIVPSCPNCLYLVASDDQITYIMRSLSSGEDSTWTVMDDTTTALVAQAGYNMAIAVDPENLNTVYVGAVALFKSISGGTGGSWVKKPQTHQDHHDLLFHNGYLYNLNDGGIARSVNGGDEWENITSGIEIFETYDVAGTPQDTNLIYAGGQDTGGNRIDPGGVFVKVMFSGDVTTCLQDPTDVNKSYMAPNKGGLRFTTDAWDSYQDTGPGEGQADFEPEFGDGIWLCPYELDQGNTDFIFTGKDSIWRLDMNAQSAQWLGYPDTGKTRAIAQGIDNRNRMYVIHANKLFYTDSALTTSAGGAAWTEIPNDSTVDESAKMRNITVNPDNANELYLVYSGNDAGNKVFYSNNSGAPGSWQNISGILPNVPVIDIIFHDNGFGNHALYIGTDIGVFYRDDSLGDWLYFSNGMPSIPVAALYINPTSNKIIAGTIGRGVWQSDVFGGCTNTIDLTGSGTVMGIQYYTVSDSIISDLTYVNEAYTDIHYKAGKRIDLLTGFHIKVPAYFQAKLGGCQEILDQH